MNPRMIRRTGLRLFALMALSCGTAAWAHNPIAECKAVDAQTYGETVDAVTLIPHMLEAFMAGDRGFRRVVSSYP